MDDNSKMPFGKHQGKPLSEVPDDYLFWLHKAGIHPKYGELAEYIDENIDGIVDYSFDKLVSPVRHFRYQNLES